MAEVEAKKVILKSLAGEYLVPITEPYTAGEGIFISDNVISINTNDIYTKAEVDEMIGNIVTSLIPINNQDITITQNGTYTAGAGYTGLGTVTVNVTSTTSAELEWTQNDYNSDGTINIAVNDMLTSSVFLTSGSIIYTISSNAVGMVIICDDFSDSNVIGEESVSVIIQLTSDLSSNDIITIYNVVQAEDYDPATGEIGINMRSSEYPDEYTKFKNWVVNSSTIYSRCKVFLPGTLN